MAENYPTPKPGYGFPPHRAAMFPSYRDIFKKKPANTGIPLNPNLIPLPSNANFGVARNPNIVSPVEPSLIPEGSGANFGITRNPRTNLDEYSTVDPLTTAPLVNVDTPSSTPTAPPLITPPKSSTDPYQLLNDALQRRAQQAAMDVELRKQQQLEQGVGTYIPKSSIAVADHINKNVPQSQLSNLGGVNAGNVLTTQVVPGIGHVTDVIPTESGPGGRVMTGRYGTGSATTTDRPHPNRSITENGKQVPIADWFNDAARRQGESNQFYNKTGRKIVPDKKGDSQKFS